MIERDCELIGYSRCFASKNLAQLVLRMCNSPQRREGSEMALLLATSSIVVFGKNGVFNILLPLGPDQERESLDLLARCGILLAPVHPNCLSL